VRDLSSGERASRQSAQKLLSRWGAAHRPAGRHADAAPGACRLVRGRRWRIEVARYCL